MLNHVDDSSSAVCPLPSDGVDLRLAVGRQGRATSVSDPDARLDRHDAGAPALRDTLHERGVRDTGGRRGHARGAAGGGSDEQPTLARVDGGASADIRDRTPGSGHLSDGQLAGISNDPGGGLVADPGAARRGNSNANAFNRKGGSILVELLRPLGQSAAQDLAIRLIEEFGTLADVLRSPPAAHVRLLGHVRAWRLLQPIRRAIRHYHRADLRRGSLLDSWQQLLDYLRVELAVMPVEHFRVLYLDARNHLLKDEILSRGTVDQCQVHLRELIVRALDLHASNLILVHNHPSGDSAPSQQDIRLTRQIVEVAKNLGIAVHDHIVVARDGYTSMRAQGLI